MMMLHAVHQEIRRRQSMAFGNTGLHVVRMNDRKLLMRPTGQLLRPPLLELGVR